MLCQASFDQWRTTIMQHLSHWSTPQGTVLALWSVGMGLARSCALSAGSPLLAQGMQRKEQTGRPHLRAWDYAAPRKRGTTRQPLRVATCFPLLLGWGGLVAGHTTGVGDCGDGVGGTGRRVGRPGRLSWRCHAGGVGRRARHAQTRLAARVATAGAPAAPGAPAGRDSARLGRSGGVGPMAVAAHPPPGLASVCAHQHGGELAAHGGDLLAAFEDLCAAAGHDVARHGRGLSAPPGGLHGVGPRGGGRQSPLADPDRSAARSQ